MGTALFDYTDASAERRARLDDAQAEFDAGVLCGPVMALQHPDGRSANLTLTFAAREPQRLRPFFTEHLTPTRETPATHPRGHAVPQADGAPTTEEDVAISVGGFRMTSTGWMVTVFRCDSDGMHFCEVIRDWDARRRHQLVQNTYLASVAYSTEAELKALEWLQSLVTPRQFAAYLTVGMFIEQGPRSQATYVFRRARPTLVVRGRRILAGLCMHPQAYYHNSFCGTLTPTDDVVTHLVHMRSDEHFFWRKSGIHAPWEPECGV